MNITTAFSLWFILLCLLAGAVYASLLYYKNAKEEFSSIKNRILFVLRFICVSFIAFLLLSPMIRNRVKSTEKPIIIIAQDNSMSVPINKDSVFYKTTYPDLIKNLSEKLNAHFDVRSYSFGENVKEGFVFDYADKITDINQMLTYVSTAYYNKNIAALVLATDGLYNTGINPLHVSSVAAAYQLIPIALGDTNIVKDVIAEKINHNKLVFLNNKFTTEVVVNAFKCKGENIQMELFFDGKKISAETVYVDDDVFFKTYSFSVAADKPGKKKITISLSPVSGELTVINNTLSSYIDVIDSRQKILLLSNAPHPDISALKFAIESNINYEVKHFNMQDFKGQLKEYSLVILHNLPAQNNNAQHLLKQINDFRLPVLYVAGSQININMFNAANAGLVINNARNNLFNEVLPVINKEFTLFTLSEATQKAVLRLPPFLSNFGTYNYKISGTAFLYQKIGTVNSKNPLFFFNTEADKKTGVITGEGFWKWRLFDYHENGNHNATNEIINKTIQYLSVKAEKTNFRILSKDVYNENEPIIIDAEVYNDSYDLINTPELNIKINDKEGKAYQYTFSKTTNAYTLNAGSLPVGDYTFEATVKVGEKILNKSGSFTITAINKEALVTSANHSMLFNLSEKYRGTMFYPSQTNELYDYIVNNQEFKPVIYETLKTSELVSLPLLLFLIVLLLSIEWVIRKRSGTY